MALSPMDAATKVEAGIRLRRVQKRGGTWRTLAREQQVRPDGCTAFILLGGRGSGKTRAAAEDCLERVRGPVSKKAHVLAPTYGDVKKVCFEGVSGLLKCALPGEVVEYNKTDLTITLANGSIIQGFTAEKPDRLNGPSCNHLWIDEFGLCSVAAIDQAQFGLRDGDVVTFCGSSTPKVRPGTRHTLSLYPQAHVSRMRLQDNAANLAANFVESIVQKYKGTRLELSEIEGHLIEDVEGAIWEAKWFEYEGFRLPGAIFKRDLLPVFEPPVKLSRVVVAIDPSVTDPERKRNPHKDPDACGLGAVGLGVDGRGYVLADLSKVMAPADWARGALQLASLVQANKIIAEKNQGGDMITEVIRGYGQGVPIELVHASHGKRARAEPVAMLYEQGRVSHCGTLTDLEDELLNWDATDPNAPSPNRLDMLVWGFHALGLCNAVDPTQESRYRARRG